MQRTGKRERDQLCGWVADGPLLFSVELSISAKHGPWFDLLTPFGIAAFGTVYPADGQWDLVEVYGATRWWPLDRAGRVVPWPTPRAGGED